MKKLLVICGPTSTGKTSLALLLAQTFNGEVVSADSRQVYSGMDIGTGKDLPPTFSFHYSNLHYNSQKIGYYTDGEVRVWGYDLADPHEEFSVSRYVRVAKKVIEDIVSRGKLPILVGGTGLYLKAILDGIDTLSVPPNKELRESLSGKEARELFELLAPLDPIRAASLNPSDRKNPRRLIRAIELASSKKKGSVTVGLSRDYSLLVVGLALPREMLREKVEKRVEERIRKGFDGEVRALVSEGVPWDAQSMSSLGYRQWKEVLSGERSIKEAIAEWKQEEMKYTKRQMTWFKKDKRVNWVDTSRSGAYEAVVQMITKWYKKGGGQYAPEN